MLIFTTENTESTEDVKEWTSSAPVCAIRRFRLIAESNSVVSLCSLWLTLPNQFEGFFGGAGDDGPIADLDDRAVEQTGVRDDRGEDLRFG